MKKLIGMLVCMFFLSSVSSYALTTIVDKNYGADQLLMLTVSGKVDWQKDNRHNNIFTEINRLSFLGQCDRLRPYVELSFAKDSANQNNFIVETNAYPIYGCGLEFILYEQEKLKLFGDVGFDMYKNRITTLEYNGADIFNGERCEQKNYKALLGMSYDVTEKITPYLGARYIHSVSSLSNNTNPINVDKEDLVKPVAGVIYKVTENININVETTYYDKGLSAEAGMSVKF